MTKKMKKERPFGARDKIGYTLGDFGCNMTFQLISVQLFFFATQALGISPDVFAILIIVAKVFDAINDPIIGNIVDRRKPSKNGKYRPWIFWGSFFIAIATVLVFLDTKQLGFNTIGSSIFLLIAYMLWSIAYTAVNVPYGALNAALTDDAGQRASLSSLRNIGAGFAMLPVMLAAPKLLYYPETSDIPEALRGQAIGERFVWFALACALIGVAGFMATYFLTDERHTVPLARKEKANYFTTLKGFFKNRAMIGLCLASIFQLVFILSFSGTLQATYQSYFKNTQIAGVASILSMLPMMVFIPFMGKLTKKFGSKAICTWPNVLGIVVLLIMLFIPFPRNAVGMWIFTAMYMIGLMGAGTFMLATWSMVADCVDNQEVQTGRRDEASVYATYSFTRKVAQGIGAGMFSLVLGAVGYMSGQGDAVTSHNRSPEVATGIMKVTILIPLIGFVLIFLTLLFVYNLNKEKVIENTTYLREKHAQMAAELANEETASNEVVEDSSDETITDESNTSKESEVLDEEESLDNNKEEK